MPSPRQRHHPETYNIAVVDKTVRIIELLRDAPAGLTLQEVAAASGLVKSSIHRLLGSLKWHGYVEQTEPGGPYRLGVQCLLLARSTADTVELAPWARPFMREVVDRFDERVYLAVLHGGRALFVEVSEPRRRDLRLVGPLGNDVSYHATAAGKAIAAHLPAAPRAALLARMTLTAFTPRTRTRRADVEREWARVARTGVAVNREETIVGATFIASAIFDADGAACGAVSVGIPTARFTAQKGRTIGAALRDVCTRLSRTLADAGYRHADRHLLEQH